MGSKKPGRQIYMYKKFYYRSHRTGDVVPQRTPGEQTNVISHTK